jgi:hypothetical protein
MGKDLSTMVEEVNSASATLSKTNKADEPVSGPHLLHLERCLLFYLDLSNCAHSQHASVPAPDYRPRHHGAADKGRCGPKSRSSNVLTLRTRV